MHAHCDSRNAVAAPTLSPFLIQLLLQRRLLSLAHARRTALL
jgi:hypothetical protein